MIAYIGTSKEFHSDICSVTFLTSNSRSQKNTDALESLSEVLWDVQQVFGGLRDAKAVVDAFAHDPDDGARGVFHDELATFLQQR